MVSQVSPLLMVYLRVQSAAEAAEVQMRSAMNEALVVNIATVGGDNNKNPVRSLIKRTAVCKERQGATIAAGLERQSGVRVQMVV